jgi:NADPH:quinone reductase-like Zn-dependent oxidoreductase
MLKPLVHATFPLAETADAMDLMERREHFGKILLIP